jgi:hypothetical protein
LHRGHDGDHAALRKVDVFDEFIRFLQQSFLFEMRVPEVRGEQSKILRLQRSQQAVAPVGRDFIRVHRGFLSDHSDPKTAG